MDSGVRGCAARRAVPPRVEAVVVEVHPLRLAPNGLENPETGGQGGSRLDNSGARLDESPKRRERGHVNP
jgi:hypothetical protein